MSHVYRHLYPQVYDWDNLLQAWRKARKGKRGKPPAATFEQNVGENLLALQAELQDKNYRPGRAVSRISSSEQRRRRHGAVHFRRGRTRRARPFGFPKTRRVCAWTRGVHGHHSQPDVVVPVPRVVPVPGGRLRPGPATRALGPGCCRDVLVVSCTFTCHPEFPIPPRAAAMVASSAPFQ